MCFLYHCSAFKYSSIYSLVIRSRRFDQPAAGMLIQSLSQCGHEHVGARYAHTLSRFPHPPPPPPSSPPPRCTFFLSPSCGSSPLSPGSVCLPFSPSCPRRSTCHTGLSHGTLTPPTPPLPHLLLVSKVHMLITEPIVTLPFTTHRHHHPSPTRPSHAPRASHSS